MIEYKCYLAIYYDSTLPQGGPQGQWLHGTKKKKEP